MSELKTQEEIQQEVRNLEAQLEHYKQVDPQNVDKHNELANQISELNFSLAQMQEREVHTQEVNETNSDIAISVFDALIPDTKVFESMMGLTEFSDWRSGFYQLFDGMLAERTQLMNDKHVYELAQKDEKIRLLSGQGIELQRQLDEKDYELDKVHAELTDMDNTLNAETDKSQNYLDQLQSEKESSTQVVDMLNTTKSQLNDAQARIAELEARLAYAQETKEESKPSQSFTDRMNEIKTKNSMSADEMILRFNARQKSDEAKIQVPDLPSAVLPFQGEDGANPATDAGNNDVLVSEGAPVEPKVPSAPNVGTVHTPDLATGNVPGESTHEQVAQKTEAERIAELERRVEALESRVA